MPKSLQIDQCNLHIKFSTLNVNLNSLSLHPVVSKWPAHEGIKDGYPINVAILSLSAARDRLRFLASANETL